MIIIYILLAILTLQYMIVGIILTTQTFNFEIDPTAIKHLIPFYWVKYLNWTSMEDNEPEHDYYFDNND